MLVILGPTGTGKSEVAVEVAERIGGEIVGCDAVQLYRGFDVASAKPDASLRRRVPHHLVDEIDPERNHSLADFVERAEAAIAEIVGRDRVPIVVGGSGLYLRGLLRGLVAAGPVDPLLRDRLRRIARRHGSERMHRWLGRLDPASAARLGERDLQRVTRALEVVLSGGERWSERLERDGTWRSAQERYPTLKIGLDMPDAEMERLLGDRVDRFFRAGLVDEVRRLLAAGVPAECNAFKAIGYREVLEALRQGRPPEHEQAQVVRKTRRYVKRQRTWFRTEPSVVWLDALRGPVELAREIARRWEGFAARD